MNFEINPKYIENKSMEIIAKILGPNDWEPLKRDIVYRIIHTSGDPDYANWIDFHPQAIEAGIKNLKSGCNIITDVEMVKTGINKRALNKLNIECKCYLNDSRVKDLADKTGETRSMTAFKIAGNELNGSIVAIGNAPTALFTLLDLCRNDNIRPALIIGTPVGFVGAQESKELLREEAPVPYITVRGTKGGSPIAAAAVNALLYSLVERND
ncbi:MAG: precorrin-8X methylmutase [Bacillota bacterium]